jgi:probable phosphoglycerate mutase
MTNTAPFPRPPTLRFVLVCHGDADGAEGGGLSALGRMQAGGLARELASGVAVDAVVAAPGAAAEETASLISERLALASPRTETGLSTGAGAALETVQAEAWAVIEGLRGSYEEGTLVLVSDAAPIRALVCRALELPLDQSQRFEVAAASLTTLEFRGQRVLLAALNDVCHLE